MESIVQPTGKNLLSDLKYLKLDNLVFDSTSNKYCNDIAETSEIKTKNLLSNISVNYQGFIGYMNIKFKKKICLSGLKAKSEANQGIISIYASNDGTNYNLITEFQSIKNNIDFEVKFNNYNPYYYYRFHFHDGRSWVCYHYINLYSSRHYRLFSFELNDNLYYGSIQNNSLFLINQNDISDLNFLDDYALFDINGLFNNDIKINYPFKIIKIGK